MSKSIEQAGAQVVHDLERYLNSLGTIALISPLLGLLGNRNRHDRGLRRHHAARHGVTRGLLAGGNLPGADHHRGLD